MSGQPAAAAEVVPQVLSLGAGVQSTAILILAAHGDLPGLDVAIFADTGWEPRAVYEHLDRLEREIARPAGIPILRVRAGRNGIRSDALDPNHRFASMPLYVTSPCTRCGGSGVEDTPATRRYDEGTDEWYDVPAYAGQCRPCRGSGKQEGMGRRQCTKEYKLVPIKRAVRELLGAPTLDNGVPGRVPAGRRVQQWIGISTDEIDRALDEAGELKTGDVSYQRNRYPLLELGLSRDHCRAINEHAGFPDVPKSACIGCPYHTNRQWRLMRDTDPESWEDAVDFDRAIRGGYPVAAARGVELRGEMFLHRSRVPLDQAPIDRVTTTEWAGRQADLVHELAIAEFQESLGDDSALAGCSPYACVTGEPVEDDDEDEVA